MENRICMRNGFLKILIYNKSGQQHLQWLSAGRVMLTFLCLWYLLTIWGYLKRKLLNGIDKS